MPTPAPSGYSRAQIVLHWLVAALIVLLWLIEEEAIHIPLGLVMLALLILRTVLRFAHGVPGPVPGTSALLARAAHWGHVALYLLMFLAALLGVAYWLSDADFFEEAHEITSNALMLVALGHAVAAIWHQWVKRDGTLDRMRLRAR